MKKKFIMALSTAFVAAALCGTLAACGEQTETKTGEYSYANAWNPSSSYGIKVSVDVKGDKIESVKIVDSSYVSVTDSWENKAVWNDGIEAYLASFSGMKVADVLAAKVTTDVKGQPSAVSGLDIITGATQGTGRLILAIQNALGAEENVTTVTGSYSYANAWNPTGTPYGVAVSVDVYGGKIKSVSITSKETEMVSVSAGWENKSIWENGIENYLKSFEGMNVVDVLKAEVETNKNGQPNAVSGVDIITGATQGSGRVVLAIQNALGKENKVVVNTASAYGLVHGGHYVGVSSATVRGGKLVDLTLTEVCLPTYVQAKEDVPAADKVATQVLDHGNMVDATYYKTVIFGDYELTYNLEKNTYVTADGETMDELFKDEAACKAYYNAVVKGELAVVVNGEEKTDVMTYAKLSKEENGYWTKQDKDGNSYSRWKLNRDATVKYALENGADSLLSLVRSTEAVVDDKGANAKYWMDGDVSTGATWSDLASGHDGSDYFDYANLIVAAVDAAN